MKFIIILLLLIPLTAATQIDTSYIEELPRDKTIQFHTTFKDFSVIASRGAEEILLFRNHNWSTGLYFKWGIAELFFALPVTGFENSTYEDPNSFGTGFGINLYPRKFHFNYNFKYVQGYESFDNVLRDKFETLKNHNYFIFNRLNIHYIYNANHYSLKSAIRFNDRQVKSAGSLILAAPIAYHLGSISSVFNNQLDNYYRISTGLMIGYGYTYVVDKWATSVLAKVGFDVRYSSFRSMGSLDVAPSLNLKASSVYNWNKNFVGLVIDYYPEYDNGDNINVNIVNWKLRLFAGKRFY